MMAAKRKGPLESEFQQHIIELADQYQWRVHHSRKTNTTRKSGRLKWSTPIAGHEGYVDLTLAWGGVVCLQPELKTETGTLSDDQKEWQKAMGSDYLIWRPRHWPLIAYLLSWGQLRNEMPYPGLPRPTTQYDDEWLLTVNKTSRLIAW